MMAVDPSPQEQYLLEPVNRARMNPAGEAGGGDEEEGEVEVGDGIRYKRAADGTGCLADGPCGVILGVRRA